MERMLCGSALQGAAEVEISYREVEVLDKDGANVVVAWPMLLPHDLFPLSAPEMLDVEQARSGPRDGIWKLRACSKVVAQRT